MLNIRDLHASYGPAEVLFGVNLSIPQGSVLALLGRNGMGKSTTIKTICGMMRAKSGEITYDGRNITQMEDFRIAQAGIGLVPEGRRCFKSLSIEENLIATARRGAWDRTKIYNLFPRLQERRKQMAGTLSGGEQQMLAIGRALMTNPKLLILDEATEGLAPVIRQEIWAVLRGLCTQNLTLMIVDKSLKELLPVADTCVILEKGKSVWQGASTDLTFELQQKFLGV